MLIDTCVLSDLARPNPNARVIAWFDAASDDDLCVSALTLGEIARGIERLTSPKRRRDLEAWLTALRTDFGDRVLPVDERVTLLWGRLTAESEARGRILPTIDGLLAATALRHRLALVTRNVSDFAQTGVTLINPWSES